MAQIHEKGSLNNKQGYTEILKKKRKSTPFPHIYFPIQAPKTNKRYVIMSEIF